MLFLSISFVDELDNTQIPVNDFVRTNKGHLAENSLAMWRSKVKMVGISMLGGNAGVAGDYELGLDSIRILNREDVSRGRFFRKEIIYN